MRTAFKLLLCLLLLMGLPVMQTPTALPPVRPAELPPPAPANLTFDLGPFDPRDAELFCQKYEKARTQPSLAAATLTAAYTFLGVPYQHAESGDGLVVNFRSVDCWTLVENSLGIALAARDGHDDFESFRDHVRRLRYRDGQLNLPGARFHYYSEWLLQAKELGVIEDFTSQLGGTRYQKRVGYITARPQRYPELMSPDIYKALRAAENRINAHSWYHIAKSRVRDMENRIKEGDLLIFTSLKRDLDIAHLGLAVRRNGRIYVLHASSLGRRVVLSAQPLPQYMASQKGQGGLMVWRIMG